MTPDPTPTVAAVVQVAQLAPDQWQLVAVAIGLIVFSLGVLLAVKL